ncbi:energy-coupling factor transporter transmembrane component T family protein [Microvirga tunisiensis]|uniref:Energy-coupling factor transporter transmembrane protein EcfT n=1 Tax=Microvirga tunisiensis TaxID=2108360 RepID=A0A5N7MKL1_9HYPH|nr:energy-coupling factor transporter transmembrane protein EcfT [Microvirga tunisiensis]MPR08980.1 energy-coupling factor transporter transmembrane protein EcfT [Microvirga tunisiensis]MPR27180.1 energy-coupling factor transporter transmembrane protein EcfT [Microvirga tunisiensis]
MIAGYLAGPTWLHRVPAGLKLAAVTVLSFLVLPVTDWRVLGAGLVLVLLIYASLGREALQRLALLRPLIPFLLVIALLQGWLETWPAAAASTTRILLMVLVASLVTFTTTMQSMIDALAPVLAPLRRLGFNPRVPALGIALVLRFVPVLLSAWQQREEAWRARTGRRASIRLIPSFIAEALRMADQVAEALDARGFNTRPSAPHPPGDKL